LLSYSAHFDKDVVSTWSSGTGGAGLFGALSYAGLTSAGMSPRKAVLVMNVIPFTFGLSFWLVLERPDCLTENEPLLASPRNAGSTFSGAELSYPLTLRTKLRVTKVRFTTAMETRQIPPLPLISLFWFVSYDYCIASLCHLCFKAGAIKLSYPIIG